MRDRLIELLNYCFAKGMTTNCIADYLLENGVIVPPCKVGDTVWWKRSSKVVLEMVCVGITKTSKSLLISIARNTNPFTIQYYAKWNVDIFPTKEEAEKALKGGVE